MQEQEKQSESVAKDPAAKAAPKSDAPKADDMRAEKDKAKAYYKTCSDRLLGCQLRDAKGYHKDYIEQEMKERKNKK